LEVSYHHAQSPRPLCTTPLLFSRVPPQSLATRPPPRTQAAARTDSQTGYASGTVVSPSPQRHFFEPHPQIADGATVLVDKVRFTLELLGSVERSGGSGCGGGCGGEAWHPPLVVLEAEGLRLVTTDAAWRVVSLSAARSFDGALPGSRRSSLAHVFRLLTWEALSLSLAPHARDARGDPGAGAGSPGAAPVVAVERLRGCLRVCAARGSGSGGSAQQQDGARCALELDAELHDALLPDLDRPAFTRLVRLVAALRACLARPEFWEAQAAQGSPAHNKQPAPSPQRHPPAAPAPPLHSPHTPPPTSAHASAFPSPPGACTTPQPHQPPPSISAFPQPPSAPPPPPPPPLVRVLLRVSLPHLALRVRDCGGGGGGGGAEVVHVYEALLHGLTLRHASGSPEAPRASSLRLEVLAMELRSRPDGPSGAPAVTLLQPGPDAGGAASQGQLPSAPLFASEQALRRVHPLSEPPPQGAAGGAPPPQPMVALFLYACYPPPAPPAISRALHLHVWQAVSELEAAALQRLLQLCAAAVRAAPPATGGSTPPAAAERTRFEVHLASGTLLVSLPPKEGEQGEVTAHGHGQGRGHGGAERLRMSLRGAACALDPSLQLRVLCLGAQGDHAALRASGTRAALRTGAAEVWLEGGAACAVAPWRLLSVDAGRIELAAAPGGLLGVALSLSSARARLSAAQARRGAEALKRATRALRTVAGLHGDGDGEPAAGAAALSAAAAAAASSFWQGLSVVGARLLTSAPPAMHLVLSLGHLQAALTEAPGWAGPNSSTHGRVLARAQLANLRAEARCGDAGRPLPRAGLLDEQEKELEHREQCDAAGAGKARTPLAELSLTCEAATLDALPEGGGVEGACSGGEREDDGDAGLVRLVGPRWGAPAPEEPPLGTGTAAEAAAAAAAAAAPAPRGAGRERLLLDAGVCVLRRSDAASVALLVPLSLRAHGRLANCDVALSFADALSVAERFWPASEWAPLTHAAAPDADGSHAAAAAAIADAVAATAAAAAAAATSGPAVSGLWTAVKAAEALGCTYDLGVQLADWCLRWRPLSASTGGLPLSIGSLSLRRRAGCGAAPGAAGQLEVRLVGVQSLVDGCAGGAPAQQSDSDSESESDCESEQEQQRHVPALPPPPPPPPPELRECSSPESSRLEQAPAAASSLTPTLAAAPSGANNSLAAWMAEGEGEGEPHSAGAVAECESPPHAALPPLAGPGSALRTSSAADLHALSDAAPAAAAPAAAKTRSMWELLESDTLTWSDDEEGGVGGLAVEGAADAIAVMDGPGPLRVLPRAPLAPPPATQQQAATPSPPSPPPPPPPPPALEEAPAQPVRRARSARRPAGGLAACLSLAQRAPGGAWSLRVLSLGDSGGDGGDAALRVRHSDLVAVSRLAASEAAALRRIALRWPAMGAALAPLALRLEAPRLQRWAQLQVEEDEDVPTTSRTFAQRDAEQPTRRTSRRRPDATTPLSAPASIGTGCSEDAIARCEALRQALGALRAAVVAANATPQPQASSGAHALVPSSVFGLLPLQGELMKRSQGWPFAWEPRHFSVTWRQALYFKSSTTKLPLNLLQLTPGTVSLRPLAPHAAEGRAHAFAVSIQGEEFVMAAATHEARETWMAAFSAAAAPLEQRHQQSGALQSLEGALRRAEEAAAALMQ